MIPSTHSQAPLEATAEQLAARKKDALEAEKFRIASAWLKAIRRAYRLGEPKPGRKRKEVAALEAALASCAAYPGAPVDPVRAAEEFMTLDLAAEAFAIAKVKNRNGEIIRRRLVRFELKWGETIAQAIRRRAKEVVAKRGQESPPV